MDNRLHDPGPPVLPDWVHAWGPKPGSESLADDQAREDQAVRELEQMMRRRNRAKSRERKGDDHATQV